MSGYIDLHCHVLPGLDDGPAETAHAVALVQGLESLGFTDLYPTPHQKAGAWTPTAAERDRSLAELRAALARAECPLTVHPPGGENMWDELFLERQADASYPTYVGGKAVLVEVRPASPPPHLNDRLFDIRMRGHLPVLAHVERYLGLTDKVKQTEALAAKAALLVNLSALGGQGGWRVRGKARRLVRDGWIHAVSTDAHRVEDLRPCAAGIRWIRGHLGEEAVQDLLIDGPRRILAGELP